MDRYETLLKPYKDKVDYFIAEINRLHSEPRTESNVEKYVGLVTEAIELLQSGDFFVNGNNLSEGDVLELLKRSSEPREKLIKFTRDLYVFDSSGHQQVLRHLASI